jgi:EAL domain-containing protein (putative c-di-GMP-specific phosphodiesterase class I)
VVISASIGIAYARAGDTPEALLGAADTAMYDAKETGRTGRGERIAVNDRRSSTPVASLLQVESELASALAGGQLRLHYQPVLDLRSGEVAGAEALVRWQHPFRGLLAPGAFLPAAEVTGQINPLGRWVVTTACQALRAASGRLPGPGFRLAVNASPREVHHPDFVPTLRLASTEAGVNPEQLCVEVTEATLVGDLGETAAVLRQIRALGVHVAVDDFGTGFSSLAYLHRLPVDTLKIDQSFVRTMSTTGAGDVIVAHVISLAHSLGLSVTAEGVETHRAAAAPARAGLRPRPGLRARPAAAHPRLGLSLRLRLLSGPRTDASGAPDAAVVGHRLRRHDTAHVFPFRTAPDRPRWRACAGAA